jgi:hypothetical protein
MNSGVEFRAAQLADIPMLLNFIHAMAPFERLGASVTFESLQSVVFDNEPAARALLAFVAREPVGYAIYFYSFTSMMGRRALWLDDPFVDPAHRGGISLGGTAEAQPST